MVDQGTDQPYDVERKRLSAPGVVVDGSNSSPLLQPRKTVLSASGRLARSTLASGAVPGGPAGSLGA